MRRLVLHEFRRATGVQLTREEIVALRRTAPGVAISPSADNSGTWDLVPDQHVGVVRLPGTLVEIRPKVPLDRVLFLMAYAVDTVRWQRLLAEIGTAEDLFEAVVPLFCRLIASATYRGLLHGYRTIEEDLPGVRGRVRFADQLSRRQTMLLPVAVSYDDFTPDILENRLLLAAARRLARLPLRSVRSARALREVTAAFTGVSPVDFDGRRLPVVTFTRLNEHYHPAIRLAELILQSASPELAAGASTISSFLMDMNRLFEAFVHRAMCEALGVSDRVLRRGASIQPLDAAGRIRLLPDLTLWQSGACVALADVKYKRITGGVPNADVYQMVAYLLSTGLQRATLIYAAGELEPVVHQFVALGRSVEVRALDVGGVPSEILAAISELASEMGNLPTSRRAPPPGPLGVRGSAG